VPVLYPKGSYLGVGRTKPPSRMTYSFGGGCFTLIRMLAEK
jgi:hypothetical protein